MHGLEFLGEILAILLVALGVVWLFHKLRLPSIVGFLVTGVLIGPAGFGAVQNQEEISLIAELGVILLLFAIGVEFSIRQIWRIRGFVFGGGAAQFLITGAVTAGAVLVTTELALNQAIFVGCLVALSSTAIVLTLLKEGDATGSVHGQGMVGILIFQDLTVVALLLLGPILAGTLTSVGEITWTIGRALAFGVAIYVAARFGFPWLMERVVRTRRRELFTLVSVVVAIGTAYVAGLAGLSLALGAFLAGVVISESRYSHQMLSELGPFRDVFNALFFVSIGMLLDARLFLEEPLLLFGIIAFVLAFKAIVATSVILFMGYGLRVGLLVGLGLAQVGEFSFVLAMQGLDLGIISGSLYSLFIGASVLTMAITPLMFRFAEFASRRAEEVPALSHASLTRARRTEEATSGGHGHLDFEDHVIIVGFGLNGRNVARVLRTLGAPYVIVELNAQTVRDLADREPIVFGDATHGAMLDALGIEQARALVIAVGDAATCRAAVATARRANPDVVIVARTRYEFEVEALYELGATEVIPEEFETSLALAGTVMEAYGASPQTILAEKEAIRREHYGPLIEGPRDGREQAFEELLRRVGTTIVVIPEACEAIGRSLVDLDLRARTGATVVAVLRDEDIFISPGADFALSPGDRVLLAGQGGELDKASRLLTR